MFRRRRKFNGIWAPVIRNTTLTSVDVPAGTAVGAASVVLDAEQILSGDEPVNESTAPTLFGGGAGGLALATRDSYLIQRIVGKFHCSQAFLGDTSAWQVCLVKACIFVDRTDSTGALANLQAWNPYTETSSQKRVLWTRSWMLQNNFPLSVPTPQFPVNNASYGSIQDGPHIDVKVKARITYEERLFFMFSTMVILASETPVPNDVVTSGFLDVRVLIKPTSRNNR